MVSLNLKIDDKSLAEALDFEMDKIADQIFADSQNNIVQKNIIDEGTLLKSGTINRRFLNKEIVYDVPYADSIEFGRTPGSMPPVDPIKDWVRRKGIARTETEVNSIAWAIAKDIKVNGQEPRPFLGPAIEKARARIK